MNSLTLIFFWSEIWKVTPRRCPGVSSKGILLLPWSLPQIHPSQIKSIWIQHATGPVEISEKVHWSSLDFIDSPGSWNSYLSISYYGHYYRVPDNYIGRRVWTKLKGRTLSIECGGERIARYEIDERQYQDVPRPRGRDNSDSINRDNWDAK